MIQIIKKMKIKNQIRGKKAKASGARFELKVRENLESKGWICDKWTNNVEFVKETIPQKNSPYDKEIRIGKLVKVKPKFIYNPKLKRMVMVGNSGGFPDFISYRIKKGLFESNLKPVTDDYEVIGVESKMNGYLDKEEKEKASWYLKNKIFSKILIASKSKQGRKIVAEYKEFKCVKKQNI